MIMPEIYVLAMRLSGLVPWCLLDLAAVAMKVGRLALEVSTTTGIWLCLHVHLVGNPWEQFHRSLGSRAYSLVQGGRYYVCMLFAYVDETGDTGSPDLGGSSSHFCLGCVLIEANNWAESLHSLVELRRAFKSDFGVHVRSELKANYLLRNGGPLKARPLPPPARKVIYSKHLELLPVIGAKAFAICIDKEKHPNIDYFETAWTYLLQRLERASSVSKEQVMLFHDDGENDKVRRLFRKARYHLTAGSSYGVGSLRFEATQFLEDPISRNSQHSYLIQCADLVAYAAWRSVVPPGQGIAKVCHQDMWDNLGGSRLAQVSKSGKAKPGIVLW